MRLEAPGAAEAQDLRLPCWAVIASRNSRLSRHMKAVDTKTSDEFILGLVQHMSEMELSNVKYEVVPRGGSLLWSRILEIEAAGVGRGGGGATLMFRDQCPR